MALERPFTGKSRGGKRTVLYRDALGKTTVATVTGAGAGANEVNLRDPVRRRTVSNVPLATAQRQNSRYYNSKTK